ncbi:MAG: hypothetical protein J1G04_03520 [Clostridiales bacterium]|nr:hypothetical protein [Clostridiales bacterium]
MLDKEISNLIAYAENYLMMDRLDESSAVRRITSALHIADYTPVEPDEEVDGTGSPHAIVEKMLAYALEKGIVTQDTVAQLRAEILDAVSLKPSEINDLFADTHSVNKQKAFDFLYDYSIRNGYVDLVACAKNDRWEAKELKSKIDVIINLMPEAKVGGYPECGLCKENMGYKDHANMRAVLADVGGEEWTFNYVRHQYFDKHGVLSNSEHVPMTAGKVMIDKLASAAEFMGSDAFVCTNAIVKDGGAKITSHEHFQTGCRTTPMLKADIKRKLKSKEYPYLEMGLVDWYSTVIRFSHSSAEKTAEFAALIDEEWRKYSDERIVNDGTKNFCNFVVRKQNGKYIYDVVLRSNGMKKPKTSPEYGEIKTDALSITDIMGYFVLPTKLSEELKQVQLYLDGTIPFEPATLPAQMKHFEKMIERMLKAQGGTVTKLEAKLNVHDEVDLVCEKMLSSTAVFDNETIKPFLNTLGIDML